MAARDGCGLCRSQRPAATGPERWWLDADLTRRCWTRVQQRAMNGLLLQNSKPRRPQMRPTARGTHVEPYFPRRVCEEVRVVDARFKQGTGAKAERPRTREGIRARAKEIQREIKREREARKVVEKEMRVVRERQMRSSLRQAEVRKMARSKEQNYTGAGEKAPVRADGMPYYGRRSCELTKMVDEEILRNSKSYLLTDQMASLLVSR